MSNSSSKPATQTTTTQSNGGNWPTKNGTSNPSGKGRGNAK